MNVLFLCIPKIRFNSMEVLRFLRIHNEKYCTKNWKSLAAKNSFLMRKRRFARVAVKMGLKINYSKGLRLEEALPLFLLILFPVKNLSARLCRFALHAKN